MVERMIRQAMAGNPIDFNGVAINNGYFRHEDAVALLGLNRRDLKKYTQRGIVPRPILDMVAEALDLRFIGRDGRGGMGVCRVIDLLQALSPTLEGAKRITAEWLVQKLARAELGAAHAPLSTHSLVRLAELYGARD